MEARFQITVPSTYSQPDAALAYWLSNPLLPAGRVAATWEAIRTYNREDKQKLVHRLYTQLENLRRAQPYNPTGYRLLKDLVRHELVSKEERTSLGAHFARLRGAEIDWEFTRLEAALTARIDAEYGRAHEAAQPAFDEAEADRWYDECDRDIAA